MEYKIIKTDRPKISNRWKNPAKTAAFFTFPMSETMTATRHSRRLHELDSLRGVAAFCVVLHHVLWLWKDEVLAKSPAPARGLIEILLQPISAGHEAVILFFILSGLVLSIPVLENGAQSYPVFLTRRVFRIYFPYLAALALAVACNLWLFGNVTGKPLVSPVLVSARRSIFCAAAALH